ncbi:MAG: ABC transporter permease, partial [Proteobacteria bacterium]|nr:ABC transporter permease [Pseudomonadota bacterium]
LALAVVATLGNSLVLFIGLMGIYGWERYARLTRGLTLSAVTHGYAVAVRTLGAGPLRIYGRHILPNIANALIVNMTLNFPQTILLETSLSFLGLGIQPPLTSLGNMVGFGRDYLLTAWWIAVFPALAIFIATLAMSILGDWVRDRLVPTLKTSTRRLNWRGCCRTTTGCMVPGSTSTAATKARTAPWSIAGARLETCCSAKLRSSRPGTICCRNWPCSTFPTINASPSRVSSRPAPARSVSTSPISARAATPSGACRSKPS